MLTMERPAGAQQPITVNYNFINGSAFSGVDFVDTSGAVTLSPSQTEASINIQTLSNVQIVNMKTFSIQFISQTAGTTIASGDTFHVTIFDFDECGNNPCFEGSTCENLLLDYRCICQPGRSGRNCTQAIDGCSSQPCVTGTCSPIGVIDFTCRCPVGFRGQTCDTPSPVQLFPFGTANGDTPVMRVSNRITISDPVWIGCNRYQDLWVNFDGYISFGSRVMQRNPSQFQLPNAALIAGFWSDYQTSGSTSTNQSIAYYHVYQEDDNVDVAASTEVIGRASELTGMGCTSVILATYVNMVAHPFRRNRDLGAENSFQIVVCTDARSSQSSAVFLYDRIDGDTFRENSVGFTSPGSDGKFLNVRGSGSPLAYDLDIMSGPVLGGNDPTIGVHSYTLSNSGCTLQSPELLRCRLWARTQRRQASLPVINDCPCNSFYAVSDFRYQFSGFYIGANVAVACFHSFSLFRLSYNLCCYNLFGGNLITSPVVGSGFTSGINPVFNPLGFFTTYLQPFQDCCLASGRCNLFYSLLPRATCQSYTPPSFSWCFGDPHLQSLDGFDFTFNGIGEYTLVNSSNFVVQGRTVLARDTSGNLEQATVFKAFVVELNSAPTVEVIVNDGVLTILEGRTNNLTQWFIDAQVNDTQTNAQYGMLIKQAANQLAVFFNNGFGIQASFSSNQLELMFSVGPEFRNNSTRGLLGTPDGIQSNDFTAPNGASIPLNSTSREIFDYGEQWKLRDEAESLFTRFGSENVDTFNIDGFVPLFFEDIVLTPAQQNESQRVCGGNQQCIFDLVVTDNAQLAAQTASQIMTVNNMEQVLANSVPQISGMNVIRVKVGELFTMNVTITDDDTSDTLTLFLANIPASATFDNTTVPNVGIFRWTPTLSDQSGVNIQFTGSDSNGASAVPLTVLVRFCNCNNANNTCDYDNPRNGSNLVNSFALVRCFCHEAYTGESCESDFDACPTSGCANLTSCTDESPADHISTGIAFTCGSCPDGRQLSEGTCIDINECSDPSLNMCSQTCTNTDGSFTCSCLDGFTLNGDGRSCSDINECLLSTDNCQQNCTNTAGGFTCSCFTGYEMIGSTCNLTTLAQQLCNGSSCSQLCTISSASTIRCECERGYMLAADNTTCTNINECNDMTGVLNQCEYLAGCVDVPGTYSCRCPDGSKLAPNNRNCTVCDGITEWGPDCTNSCNCRDATTVCDPLTGCASCPDGFSGGSCDVDVNECLQIPSPCGANATCSNTVGSYNCTCNAGFTRAGANCALTNLCEVNSPCQNGATCTHSFMDYACSCAPGYTDRNCSTDINECASVTCQNGGACQDRVNGFECTCTIGWTGLTCTQAVMFIPRFTHLQATFFITSHVLFDVDIPQFILDLNNTLMEFMRSTYSARYSSVDRLFISGDPINVTFTTIFQPNQGTSLEDFRTVILTQLLRGSGAVRTLTSPSAPAANPVTYSVNISSVFITEASQTVNQPIPVQPTNAPDLCTLLSPCQNNATCTRLPASQYSCTCASGFMGQNCSDAVPPVFDRINSTFTVINLNLSDITDVQTFVDNVVMLLSEFYNMTYPGRLNRIDLITLKAGSIVFGYTVVFRPRSNVTLINIENSFVSGLLTGTGPLRDLTLPSGMVLTVNISSVTFMEATSTVNTTVPPLPPNPTPAPTEPSPFPLGILLGIIFAVAAVILLIIVMVSCYFCVYYRRSSDISTNSDYHSSDQPISFPRPRPLHWQYADTMTDEGESDAYNKQPNYPTPGFIAPMNFDALRQFSMYNKRKPAQANPYNRSNSNDNDKPSFTWYPSTNH